MAYSNINTTITSALSNCYSKHHTLFTVFNTYQYPSLTNIYYIDGELVEFLVSTN